MGPTRLASHTWIQETVSPGAKQQGSEVDHPPPSSGEVKNGSSICLRDMVLISLKPWDSLNLYLISGEYIYIFF
jgi:hypothetical protein